MIYINQIGAVELGRGQSLDSAVSHANQNGAEISKRELRYYRPDWPATDGEVVYMDEPLAGYNDK